MGKMDNNRISWEKIASENVKEHKTIDKVDVDTEGYCKRDGKKKCKNPERERGERVRVFLSLSL